MTAVARDQKDNDKDGKDAAPPQLSVSGRTVRFGSLTALDGVELNVRAGEVVPLAGDNGAGKTTRVRRVGDDIAPTSGTVTMDGLDGSSLVCAVSLGLSAPLRSAWSRLPVGPAGRPVRLVVWAEHDRLEQVVVSSPGAKVAVSATTDGPGAVTARAADNDDGMPAELVLVPFEPMRRPGTCRPGAGPGLSTAQGIVAAHGGRIELEQSLQGPCFRIHLPVGAAGTPASVDARPDAGRPPADGGRPIPDGMAGAARGRRDGPGGDHSGSLSRQ